MKYHLDSMLPLRAFSPRSGRARGFAAGGMTLEGDGYGGAPLGFQWTPENQGNWNEPAPAPVDAGAVVQQMYQEILGRAPDPGGFEAFVNAVNSGADIGQLAQSMANSQEAQNNAASGQGPSQGQVQNAVNQATSDPGNYAQQAASAQANKDYVTALYQAVLGRAPDAQGLQDNLNALASGRVTPEQLAQSFAGSAEAGSNNISSAQEQQMAQAMASSYGRPNVQLTTDSRGYPAGWENVSPAQLVKMGITNPVILKAAADGVLDNPTFGALGLDANVVKNSVNSGDALPQDFIVAQQNTASSFTPNGKVTATINAGGGKTVKYYSDGATALFNADGSIDHITPPVSNYRQQEGSIARTDNPGYVMFQGQMVKVETPALTYDPAKGAVTQNKYGMPTTYDPGQQGGWLDTHKQEVAVIGAIAMAAAAPFTGGASLAVGEAILGAGAVGAATVGAAVMGAGTSALYAVATGGDPGKAALLGAIGAGIGANAADIANGLVGADNIKAIASATGQTVAQTQNLITNAVSTAVSTAAAGGNIENLPSLIATSLASSAIGNYAGNIVNSINPGQLNMAVKAVSSVAKVGTTAALKGNDVNAAINANIAQIIGNTAATSLTTSIREQIAKDKADNPNAPSVIPKDQVKQLSDAFDSEESAKLWIASNGAIVEPDQATVDKATTVAQESGDQRLIDAVENKNYGVINTLASGEFSPGEVIDKALSSLMSSAVAAPNPQPNNPNAREAYYTNINGVWKEVVNDVNGNQKVISDIVVGDHAEGQKSGSWYDVSLVGAEGGAPVRLTAEQTTPKTPVAGEPTPEEKAADEKALAAQKAKDDAALAAIKASETPTPTPGPNIADIQLPDNIKYDTDPAVKATYQVKALVAQGVPMQDAITTAAQANSISASDLNNTLAVSPTIGANTSTSGSNTAGGSSTTGSTDTAGGSGTTGGATTGGATTGGDGLGGTTGTTGSGTGGTGTGTGTGGTGSGSGGGTGTGSGGGTGTGTGGTGGTGTKTTTGGTGTKTTTTGTTTTTTPTTDPGIVNLVGGVSLGDENYKLIDSPFGDYKMDDINSILGFATGGSTDTAATSSGNDVKDIASMFGAYLSGAPKLTAGAMKPRLDYSLNEGTTEHPLVFQYAAEGGQIGEHQPEFFSEGGLSSIENRYVKGEGDGTSDSIPAMLANGEFVIPADVVSSLGNGSNDSGAHVLDEFLKTIREHKRKADAKQLPEDSKGPLAYLLEAHNKVGN